MDNKLVFKIIYILAVIFYLAACSTHLAIKNSCIDSEWKRISMLEISKKYMNYQEKFDPYYKRPPEVALYAKFYDLNRYPFGDAFGKLQSELTLNKISFDSIICSTLQYDFGSNPEYLYPNTYSIFLKGKIIAKYTHDPEKLILEKENDFNLEECMNLFEKMSNKTDGDDLSLIVLTKIKPDWTFEISKVIINSNPIIYDND